MIVQIKSALFVYSPHDHIFCEGTPNRTRSLETRSSFFDCRRDSSRLQNIKRTSFQFQMRTEYHFS